MSLSCPSDVFHKMVLLSDRMLACLFSSVLHVQSLSGRRCAGRLDAAGRVLERVQRVGWEARGGARRSRWVDARAELAGPAHAAHHGVLLLAAAGAGGHRRRRTGTER